MQGTCVPKIADWLAASSSGPGLRAGCGRCEGGQGRGLGRGVGPVPSLLQLLRSLASGAKHMEAPEKPKILRGGREATPVRHGPRCLRVSNFREELRALLVLAGPAVSSGGLGAQ